MDWEAGLICDDKGCQLSEDVTESFNENSQRYTPDHKATKPNNITSHQSENASIQQLMAQTMNTRQPRNAYEAERMAYDEV